MTLSYDRLGIGKSQHGDPLNEIQTNLEVAALHALTTKLRDGNFPSVNSSYDTVVHVGHSFGSVQSYIFAHLYPSLTQGIVLTGFSLNSSFMGYFLAGGNLQQASINSPLRFGSPSYAGIVSDFLFEQTPLFDYLQPIDITTLSAPQDLPDGYIVPANAGANQYQFLLPPYFDPEILPVVEKSKQPVTLGEILTIGSSAPAPNDFAGPVLVFTGGTWSPFY